MKLKDIAHRIAAHLKRFEADPKINLRPNRPRRFYHAGCTFSSRWVYVRYVEHEGSTALTKSVALHYLAWLDAGNVGRHWRALK